jgi:hypothetical protein
MLVRNAIALEEGIKLAVWYHQCNQSTHDWWRDNDSCSASLVQKISEATDHLCHTALNQKLLHKFKKWCKFSSCDKAKSHKMRPACTSKKYRSRISKEEWYLCLIFHQAILFYSIDYCEMSTYKILVLTTYPQVQMLDRLIHTRRPISLELNGSWVVFWKILSVC